MKDFDNIEDWYRDELDKFNVEPDNNVWQSLSDDLDADMTLTDENIGEWYKREVSKLEERPDYTVWEKLATKLDTASVWDRLVVSLNRHEQYIWWRNVIIKGSAILLLLTSSYVTYNNFFADKEDNSANKVVVNEDDSNQANSKIDYSSVSASDNTSSNNPLSNTSIASNISSSKTSATTSKKLIANSIQEAKESVSPTKRNNRNNNPINDKTTYASLSNTPKEVYFNNISVNTLDEIKTKKERDIIETDRRNITERDISHIYNSSDFLVKKEKNKIVFNSKRFSSYFTYGLYARRFYFGANAGVKKQGLITNIRKDGPLANFNQVEYLDFGSNFGFTAGYIVSDKFNIEANLNTLSTSGYQRRYNGEGNSFEEELNLNYTTLNILAKKMNTKSTFDNKVYSTNLIGGVYASLLNTSSSVINGNKVDNNNFNNTDFGIVLGIEQDRYITKTLIVTPGVRYNQGLTNVADESNAFKSARNFSFEFNLGVKYIFLKKSK